MGGGANSEAISTLIQKNGLGGAIRMRGRYPEGRAYIELLQSYDLKLLPTVGEEGAPLVLLEAMACGLPFVANGVGGIPDYNNPDCLITNGNIGGFIPSVIAMVQRLRGNDLDPARLQGCYEDKFSYKHLVDRWEDVLTRVVNGTDTDGHRRVT